MIFIPLDPKGGPSSKDIVAVFLALLIICIPGTSYYLYLGIKYGIWQMEQPHWAFISFFGFCVLLGLAILNLLIELISMFLNSND